MMLINKDEDLFPLAATAIRRLEKLTSINKKFQTKLLIQLNNLKIHLRIADNIASHITLIYQKNNKYLKQSMLKKD